MMKMTQLAALRHRARTDEHRRASETESCRVVATGRLTPIRLKSSAPAPRAFGPTQPPSPPLSFHPSAMRRVAASLALVAAASRAATVPNVLTLLVAGATGRSTGCRRRARR